VLGLDVPNDRLEGGADEQSNGSLWQKLSSPQKNW
jgi:hypothetical protein